MCVSALKYIHIDNVTIAGRQVTTAGWLYAIDLWIFENHIHRMTERSQARRNKQLYCDIHMLQIYSTQDERIIH